MGRTFNCGIGMVLVVDAQHVGKITDMLKDCGEPVYEMGKVVRLQENGGEPVKILHLDQAWA